MRANNSVTSAFRPARYPRIAKTTQHPLEPRWLRIKQDTQRQTRSTSVITSMSTKQLGQNSIVRGPDQNFA